MWLSFLIQKEQANGLHSVKDSVRLDLEKLQWLVAFTMDVLYLYIGLRYNWASSMNEKYQSKKYAAGFQ